MEPFKSDSELGREIGKLLCDIGIAAEIPECPRTKEFADAALDEIGNFLSKPAGLYKDMLEGSEIGAHELDVEPLHGLNEIVQNADDAGASTLLFGIESQAGKQILTVVHDGEPVELRDVVAMALPWVSTKRNDALTKGKFGIGLKTLFRITNAIEVSSDPYYFRIIGGQIKK